MIDDRRVPNAPDESSAASTRGLPRAPSPNATSPASSPAATTAMRHSASAAAPLLITRPRSLLVAVATTEQRGQSKKLFYFEGRAKSVIEIMHEPAPVRLLREEKTRRCPSRFGDTTLRVDGGRNVTSKRHGGRSRSRRAALPPRR